jgi:hypothetical protein
MNQQEHIQRIRARCVELLALAEKRTEGRWEHWECATANIYVGDHSIFANNYDDAIFIASCAGPAEAGWKATIAAIDLMFAMHGLAGIDIYALDATGDIIAAWPEELL